MKTYTKLHAIYASFYSVDLYRDVKNRWEGLGFSYLFLLVALIITPAMLILLIMIDRTLFGNEYNPEINNIANEIIEQMPTLQWHDNQMTVIDGEDIKTITISIDDKTLPIIKLDIDGTEDTLRDSNNFMLLTAQSLYFKKMGGEIDSRAWADIIEEDGFTLNPTTARELADEGIKWLIDNRTTIYLTFGFFFWAFTVLAFYFYRIIEALIIGFFGLLIQRFFQSDLDYGQLVRLAAIAMTPAIIIDIALLAAGLGGISLFMFFVVSCGYLGFGIKSLRT